MYAESNDFETQTDAYPYFPHPVSHKQVVLLAGQSFFVPLVVYMCLNFLLSRWTAADSADASVHRKHLLITFFKASFPFLPIELPPRSTSTRLCDACTRGARATAPASVTQFPLKIKRDKGTTTLLRCPSSAGSKMAFPSVTPSSRCLPDSLASSGDLGGDGVDPAVFVPLWGAFQSAGFALGGWVHLRSSTCTTCRGIVWTRRAYYPGLLFRPVFCFSWFLGTFGILPSLISSLRLRCAMYM